VAHTIVYVGKAVLFMITDHGKDLGADYLVADGDSGQKLLRYFKNTYRACTFADCTIMPPLSIQYIVDANEASSS
jgi:hypothetical protein